MVIMTGAIFFFFCSNLVKYSSPEYFSSSCRWIVFKIDLLDQMLHKPIITHIPTCRKKLIKSIDFFNEALFTVKLHCCALLHGRSHSDIKWLVNFQLKA